MKVIDWCFLGSVGLHLVFWLGIPNPIPPQTNTSELQIISLTPVVEIPSTSIDLSQTPSPNSSLNIDGSSSDLVTNGPPTGDGLAVPPLDLSAKIPAPPDDLPTDFAFEKLPVISPSIPKQSSGSIGLGQQYPVALPPDPSPSQPTAIPRPSTSPKLDLSVSKPSPPPQIPRSLNSTSLESSGLSPEDYSREFGNLFIELANRCGADNVIRSTIPTPGKDLVSQINEQIESSVTWIPPVSFPEEELLQNLEIIVRVTLVVEADGQISRRRFLTSDLEIIDGIVAQTLDGYEGKFSALPGKCRLVTVNYYFPDKSRQ